MAKTHRGGQQVQNLGWDWLMQIVPQILSCFTILSTKTPFQVKKIFFRTGDLTSSPSPSSGGRGIHIPTPCSPPTKPSGTTPASPEFKPHLRLCLWQKITRMFTHCLCVNGIGYCFLSVYVIVLFTPGWITSAKRLSNAAVEIFFLVKIFVWKIVEKCLFKNSDKHRQSRSKLVATVLVVT